MESIILQEVSPRDGLQNESVVLSPEIRADLVDDLVDAGLSRIQIGSFVHPRRVPQMAGADHLWKSIEKRTRVRYSVLVLNDKGLQLAIQAGVRHVEIFASASDTQSMKNTGMSIAQATTEACRMIERAHSHDLTVTAGVMCAFGCYYEGMVPPDRVMEIVNRFEALKPEEISLADTTGMGTPVAVRSMLQSLAGTIAIDRLTLHLHDTHGNGVANLKTAIEGGVRRFDTSVGGLGGCPFIPGAKGNISTEQTVQVAESMGYATGVDLNRLQRVKRKLETLLNKRLPV